MWLASQCPRYAYVMVVAVVMLWLWLRYGYGYVKVMDIGIIKHGWVSMRAKFRSMNKPLRMSDNANQRCLQMTANLMAKSCKSKIIMFLI